MVKKQAKPLWKGPEVDGITQSMLQDFITCRERFRVKYVEGWREADQFIHRMEYGNMFHLCEETYRNEINWQPALKKYTKNLCERYKGQQEQIIHWYNVCLIQFPIYVAYWKKHDKSKGRKTLLSECTFAIPYELPSGRRVLIRGKWDQVNDRKEGIELGEHKTKSDIKEEQLKRQLLFDLQTMLYVTALQRAIDTENPDLSVGEFPVFKKKQVTNIHYNVVRRPLGGGKHSISQKQSETKIEFYDRLDGLIRENSDFFFMRWEVTITPSDIKKFETQFLIPCLEQLCDWWEVVKVAESDLWRRFGNKTHFRLPYGIYNPIAEYGSTPLDDYLDTGSTLGLERATALFRELD